jgi:WD40 repeat protein
LPGTSAAVACLAYASDGATLASGHDDGTVHVWDLAAGKSLSTFRVTAPDGRPARPSSLAFGRKDKALAVVGSSLDNKGTGSVWDWALAKRLGTVPAVASIMADVAWTPDGKALLVASKNDGVRWFDLSTDKDLGPLSCRDGNAFWCVAVSPDGRRAAATSQIGTVAVWDLANKQQIASLQGHAAGAFGLSFDKDSRTLAVGYSNNGWIKLGHRFRQ